MAVYKEPSFLYQTNSDDFDRVYKPGQRVTMPGIYRCCECGYERVFNGGERIPPEHRHSTEDIYLWELIVRPNDITF